MRGQFVGDDVVLGRALPFLVHGAAQLLRTSMYREFGKLGLALTPEQWIVLVELWREDGRTQSELADLTLRDRPTLSRMFDTMEREGLVVRKADATDARARRVFLTAKGRSLKGKLVPVAKALVRRLESGIDAADLETTHRTLGRMMTNLR